MDEEVGGRGRAGGRAGGWEGGAREGGREPHTGVRTDTSRHTHTRTRTRTRRVQEAEVFKVWLAERNLALAAAAERAAREEAMGYVGGGDEDAVGPALPDSHKGGGAGGNFGGFLRPGEGERCGGRSAGMAGQGRAGAAARRAVRRAS